MASPPPESYAVAGGRSWPATSLANFQQSWATSVRLDNVDPPVATARVVLPTIGVVAAQAEDHLTVLHRVLIRPALAQHQEHDVLRAAGDLADFDAGAGVIA